MTTLGQRDEKGAAVSPTGKARLRLPSVDQVLRCAAGQRLSAHHGHPATVKAIRAVLENFRADPPDVVGIEGIAEQASFRLDQAARPSQRRVFNLTGTVLHTNLGRAVLSQCAIDAAVEAMRFSTNLEYDLEAGLRGDRDDHLRGLVRELTGAEDVLVVNNNAAAVLLVLNSLAKGREVIVSRGELIEIGGAFRMPDVMVRAGARLKEVGTTNRTHLRDYEQAIGPKTALLMKVHTSNYVIEGFTTAVDASTLATAAHAHGLPLVDDLGSGTLIDLTRFGLPPERTVQDALADGADLVTFSGDKLLGGIQAGFVVGRRELLRRIASNPLKRALRLDKMRLAALEATLKLYRDPDRLAETLPTLGYFKRTQAELRQVAEDLSTALGDVLGPACRVAVMDCASQIGSGAVPRDTLASAGLAISFARRRRGSAMETIAAAFRALPIPCIGRIEKGVLMFDLRCLDDRDAFVAQLKQLNLAGLEADRPLL